MNSASADASRASQPSWPGRAALGAGWAAFHGLAGDSHVHRHHAVQIVVAGTQPIQAWLAGKELQSSFGMIIGTDTAHRLLPTRTPFLLLLLEGQSRLARALNRRIDAGASDLTQAQRDALWDWWLEQGEAAKDPRAALAQVFAVADEPAACGSPGAHRVVQTLQHLPTLPTLPRTLSDLAADAALSPSRFAHLFRQQTGMAVRPYLRWLRLQRALLALVRGASLTEAALAAEFADGAHLSRTCRHHLGLAPSAIIAALRDSADTFKR